MILTDGDVFLCEKRVHFINISHELSISKREVCHVSPSLCCSHQLNQCCKKTTTMIYQISIISILKLQRKIIYVLVMAESKLRKQSNWSMSRIYYSFRQKEPQ